MGNSELRLYHQLIAQLRHDAPGAGVDVLLQHLPEREAQLLRLCAIPHSFSVGALAALDQSLSAEEAMAMFDRLAGLSVVQTDGVIGRLHDVTRAYLLEEWRLPANRNAYALASERLAAFYRALRTSTARPDDAERYAYLEMYHLLAARPRDGLSLFRQLFRDRRKSFRIGECERLVRLFEEQFSAMPQQMRPILDYRRGQLAADHRRWAEAQEWFSLVLTHPATTVDLQVRARNRLGMAAAARRQYQEATQHYEAALELASRSPESEKYLYRILHDLGSVYRDTGDVIHARELLGRSIQFARRAGDASSVAIAYNSLGMLLRSQHDPAGAIDAYEASLQALAESKDLPAAAQVKDNLGVAYADRGEFTTSLKLHEESLNISRQSGDTAAQARTLNNLARVYRSLGDAQSSVTALRNAITLFETAGDTHNAAITRRNLARELKRGGHREEVRTELTRAIEMFERAGDARLSAETRSELDALDHHVNVRQWAIAGFLFAAILITLVTLLIMGH